MNRLLVLFLLLLVLTGCTTVRVQLPPDHDYNVRKSVQFIRWASTSELYGRDNQNVYANNVGWSRLDKGKDFVKFEKYSDIQEVYYKANFWTWPICFGILSPSLTFAKVILHMKDGEVIEIKRIGTVDNPIWAWFPFYILKPLDGLEHSSLAQSFEFMRQYSLKPSSNDENITNKTESSETNNNCGIE